MSALIVIAVAVFGALIGSFLNVVIWRVPRGESIAFPASHCPSCGRSLRWFHNVPVLSWLALRGRCAFCGTGIRARYPLVEGLTAVLAVTCLLLFGPTWVGLRSFAFVAMLVSLTYIDLDHWLLPHAVTWPGIALGLVTAWLPGAPGLAEATIGAAAGFGSFWLIQRVAEWGFKREALGGGDLFLFAMIGAFLGWRALLPVLFLASFQGSLIGIGLLLLRGDETASEVEAETAPYLDRDDPLPPRSAEEAAADADECGAGEEDDWVPPRNAVPFGPFLSLGALQMLFAGDLILGWALRLLGLE